MKAVAANLVPPVPLIRQRVKVRVVGQRLVKRRVEDRDLREPRAEDLARRLYAADVRGVVQRRELYAVLYPAQHVFRNRDRMREVLAAVHDPVPDRVNVRHAPHGLNPRIGRRHPTQDCLDGRPRVAHRRGRTPRLRVPHAESQNRLAPDALNAPPRQTLVRVPRDAIQVRRDNLKLDGRTPAVQNENIHDW